MDQGGTLSDQGRDALYHEIMNAINHVNKEFDMQAGEIIGILESVKLDIHSQVDEEEEEEEEEECNDSDT